MRTTLILAMFAASLANAGWTDFEDVRELKLDARDSSGIEVQSRAGSLEVVGVAECEDGSGSITVNGVGKDLTIVESGSGSVNYSNVQGVVREES